MQSPNQKPAKIQIGNLRVSRRLLIFVCLVILAVPVALYLYNYSFLSPRNYAQEVAQPLEDALVKAGAVKKCNLGDNGRGADNSQPWYTAYFELSRSNQAAKQLIDQVAQVQGYRLEQTSPGTKGYLGDTVYVDSTSKSNTLAMALTNSGPLHACPNYGEITADANHTAVALEVRLPATK